MDRLLTISPKNTSILTMSTVEIAQLCGKRHDNVMTDAKKMLTELNLNAPDFLGTYKTSQGNEYQCFYLPKREVMILVSGYRIDLRAKIIDRLEELENQQKTTALLPDFTNPAESARAWAEEYEKRQIAEQQAALMKPKADFVDNYVSAGGSKSLRETAKILKMPERDLIMKLISDKCLYRTSGNGNLLPYQSRHSQDLFTVKTGVTDNGHNYTQTRVTAKGIQWIANRYASELMS